MKDIEEIITEVAIWSGTKNISYEPLNGGYVNCTYKVNVDNLFYVLRVNGQQNDFLKLKRKDEIKAIHKASEIGIAPKVFNVENKSEYLITEYKQGEIINKSDIHDPVVIKKVAENLVKIHKLSGIDRVCSPFYLVEKYLEGATILKVQFPDGLKEVLKYVTTIENRNSKNFKYTKKYCHNDYYTFNMINNNGNITVIDWELSGIGDLFFDLATISSSNAFSETEDALLLKSYFGFIENEHKILLYDMKYMNMLREISWALLHSGMEVKKVNHDLNYYECALWFLNRLKGGFVTV